MRLYTYQQLKDEIERRGMRHNAVARRAGFTQQDLSRLFSLDPQGTASMDATERLLGAIEDLAAGNPETAQPSVKARVS